MDPYGPAGYTVIGPDGGRYGPVDAKTLRSWVTEGRIVAGTAIEDPISGRTHPAAQMPELSDMFNSAPPSVGSSTATQMPSVPTASPGAGWGAHWEQSAYPAHGYGAGYAGGYAGPPKQKLVAILLAFFLGGLGVHRFYLGHTSTGIAILVLSFATCGVVSSIWAIVDIILIATGSLREANGRPLA